jgi:hypothetical protein
LSTAPNGKTLDVWRPMAQPQNFTESREKSDSTITEEKNKSIIKLNGGKK